MTFDEYGRPFLVIRDQERKSRLSGLEAQKVRKKANGHGNISLFSSSALLSSVIVFSQYLYLLSIAVKEGTRARTEGRGRKETTVKRRWNRGEPNQKS